jgi:hypothetical protein
VSPLSRVDNADFDEVFKDTSCRVTPEELIVTCGNLRYNGTQATQMENARGVAAGDHALAE